MSPRFPHEDSNAQTTQNRRRFLLGLGAASAAAIAGCSSDDSTDDDNPTDDSTTDSFDPASELPYGQWLTAADDGILFAYADLEASRADSTPEISPAESLEDPLLTFPLARSQTLVGLGQLQLSLAGLTQAISSETESESTVSEFTVVNQTVVAEGSFATDELHGALTEPTDETWGIRYEQTGMINGYDQYEAAEVPDSLQRDPPVIAVTEETVVVSAGLEQLERMVAAGDGTQSRIYETNESLTQLLEYVDTGNFVVGKLGALPGDGLGGGGMSDIDPQFEPSETASVVAALELAEDDSTVESRFALANDELTESKQDTIETAFGAAATDDSVSVEVDNGQITASATYDIEGLGLADTDSSGDGSLSEAEAAELVSPDALAFQYEPLRDQQFGELWVAVTEDTDAAAIRLTADSGSSNEFEPQERSIGANDSIAVPVEPEGDAVTLSVINDEGAVGELTSQPVPTDELSEEAASQAVPEDALSFSYEAPDSGKFGSLTIEVVADIAAETLVAQPQVAPGLFTDRVGSLTSDESVGTGTTLETVVEPDGDEIIVYATVDGATGEVARWQGS